MTARLELKGLSKSFGGLAVTNDVNLVFEPGSLSAVIGPNGAGKTTLFNLVTGRLSPDRGHVLLNGVDLVGCEPGAIARAGVGRAFQIASLFSSFTVAESLAAAVMSHDRTLGRMWGRFPSPEAAERALHVMSLTGLEGLADRGCATLSHGDRKLLDIALALALQPKILLLDEPTAGMGREEAQAMVDRIHRIWQQERLTLIFIEHDMKLVFGLAQTVRVLRQGSVLAEGTPEEIRRHPAVVEAYLGSEF